VSIYCDSQSFKPFTYFQKCMYMFIMCSIITKMQDYFFLPDDGVFQSQNLMALKSGSFIV
jgi:hypothetical protein